MAVVNKLPQFSKKVEAKMSIALREGARDILVKSRNRAPLDKGGLRNEPNPIEMINPLKWRISYNKAYAAYQHRGARRDGSHRVRNYSTSGTGKLYLSKPGDEVARKMVSKFRKYA